MTRGLLGKYFWALQLAGIAAFAWIVAGGINDWIGGQLFAVPTPAGDGDAWDAAGELERGAWGRVAQDEDAAEVLAARHVFDLDPEPLTPPAPPTPPPAPPAPPEAKDDGQLDETELAIDLVGTLVMEESASSTATLEIEGRNRLGWTGSDLLGGKAKIVKIAQRHVVLEAESGLTVLRLWGDDATTGPQARRTVAGRQRPGTRNARPAPNNRAARARRLRVAIRRAGAYRYNIDRRLLGGRPIRGALSQRQVDPRGHPGCHLDNPLTAGAKRPLPNWRRRNRRRGGVPRAGTHILRPRGGGGRVALCLQ